MRPRVEEEPAKKLDEIRDKIQFMKKDDETTPEEEEQIKEKYVGSMGKVSKSRIINEALDALQERGLTEDG